MEIDAVPAVTVAALIVNWNGGAWLGKALASLHAQRRRPDVIVVVDNASSDDSLARAAAELAGVRVLRLSENAGFARANNLAASEAGPVDFLALLNPDAFAEPGWLAALLDAAERHPRAMSFASRMLLAADRGRLDGAGDAYHVSGRAWRHGHGHPIDSQTTGEVEVFAACAAAALYRRQAFEAAGGFDERYFCYFEDVDLGFRLRFLGGRCVYVPEAVVEHVSSGVAGYHSDFAIYYGERNMVWTFIKNMPGRLFWRYLPQHIVVNLAALAYYQVRGQGSVVWRAKRDALRGLPAIWRARRGLQSSITDATAHELDAVFTHGLAAPYVARHNPIPPT